MDASPSCRFAIDDLSIFILQKLLSVNITT